MQTSFVVSVEQPNGPGGEERDPRHPDIRLPPGFDAFVSEVSYGDPNKVHVDMSATHDVENAFYDPDNRHSPERWGDGITLNVPTPTNDRDLAISLATCRAVSEFHETLEWVMVNGERLADGHPEDEGEMWDWLADKIRNLYLEYIERYPL